MRRCVLLPLLASTTKPAAAYGAPSWRAGVHSAVVHRAAVHSYAALRVPPVLLSESDAPNERVIDGETRSLTDAEVEKVNNLVADDEWLGLGMELAIVFRSAVRESLKKSVRDFTGSDDYKVGDISKEVDARVKDMVADFRGKDECEHPRALQRDSRSRTAPPLLSSPHAAVVPVHR